MKTIGQNRSGVRSKSIGFKVDLESVMTFQFDPVVHRMIDKYSWNEERARSVFEDMKRYLYLGRITGKPLIPPPEVDEMWHNFILFTVDYASFCSRFLGRFIHHRPRRRDDSPTGSGFTVKDTLNIAQAEFGSLSSNWNYPNLHAKADCGPDSCGCGCSGDCTSRKKQRPRLVAQTGSCSCSDWCQCS